MTASERITGPESSVLGTENVARRKHNSGLSIESEHPHCLILREVCSQSTLYLLLGLDVFKGCNKSCLCFWVRLLLCISLRVKLGIPHSQSAKKRRLTTVAFYQGWVVTESQTFNRNETINSKKKTEGNLIDLIFTLLTQYLLKTQKQLSMQLTISFFFCRYPDLLRPAADLKDFSPWLWSCFMQLLK